MLFCFTLISSAEAKSRAEFKNLTAYQLDDENFRIEAEFKGKLEEDDIKIKSGGQFLILDIDNSIPGRISKHSGVKNDAKYFVEKIFVGAVKKNQTRINISFAENIDEDALNIRIDPENKSEKKSARLVVDFKKFVAKTAMNVEENFDINDRVIVIDPGHGGSDSGAVGHYGVKEKDVTLYVALRVEELLKKSGAKVIMTRRTDKDVASPSASNPQELQARVDKCPPETDIFVSIHCNAFSNPNSHGMETYYCKSANPQSQKLARLLNEELARYGGRFNRGVRSANYYVLRHNPHPASLVELAFITNYEEESLLCNDDYQDALAKAIVKAIERYFNE